MGQPLLYALYSEIAVEIKVQGLLIMYQHRSAGFFSEPGIGPVVIRPISELYEVLQISAAVGVEVIN